MSLAHEQARRLESTGLRVTENIVLTHSKSLFSWQHKWLLLDRLANSAAADALNADLHALSPALGQSSSDSLQIGAELATCDSGLLCTDTTQVFGFTACFNRVACRSSLATNFTNACHDPIP